MRILFLSPEVLPFTRVGGLAEVAMELPLALGRRGHQVEVVAPRCKLSPDLAGDLEALDLELEVPVSWRRHRALVHRHSPGKGVNIHLISHEHLFDREGLYGNAYGDYEDNAERFIFYSRACLELALALDWQPQVVHANDWTTGLVPLYLRSLYAGEPSLAAAGTVMTVHNLGNQGVFWHYDMPLTGLGWEYFTPEGLEFYGKLNFLKAGLVFADMVSTVSHAYAREIMTPEHGQGLEGVLASRARDMAVVMNGIDYDVWNPDKDPHIAAPFSAGDLAGRAQCRRALRESCGLPLESRRPLGVIVGRLMDRTGLDILAPALDHLLDMGMELVVMGHGEDHYHAYLQAAARRRPQHLAVKIGYSEEMAHQLMAGADMLIMPSRYEPCGLYQMQAMRYGTIPVVRATGGLDDTVDDHMPGTPGTGFKFGPFTSEALTGAVGRALEAWSQPEEWAGIVERAMARDFSWESQVESYEELYRRALERRQAAEG